MPDMSLENQAAGTVAGVDEVGRGPLAGPVVAAAVIIPPQAAAQMIADGLDDSKRLTAKKRRSLFEFLTSHCACAIGAGSIADIERLNILGASLLAMRRAVLALPATPALVLVDGNRLPELPCAARAIVGGDGKSLSIAAASVVAKVVRDRAMAALAARYPAYGWERNAGYGTREHQDALRRFGATPHHRQSFRPVAALKLTSAEAR